MVGYNIDFDISFLERAVITFENKVKFDVMKEFSKTICVIKYKKLIDCTEYNDYVWKDRPHGTLADCFATLYCYKKMTKNR